MTLSLNETHKLIKDAARGIDLSWGEADELAKAAVWLEVAGQDGAIHAVSAITDLRDSLVSGITLRRTTHWHLSPRKTPEPPVVSALIAGVTARDLLAADIAVDGGGDARVHMAAVRCPMLAVGLLVGLEPSVEHELSISIQGTDEKPEQTVIRREKQVFLAGHATGTARDIDAICQPSSSNPSPKSFKCIWSQDIHQTALEKGIMPDPDALSTLQKLAHNCLVPATEESRLKGAGAGTVDRD